MTKNVKLFHEPLYKSNGNGNDKLIRLIYKYKAINNYIGFHIYKTGKHFSVVHFKK